MTIPSLYGCLGFYIEQQVKNEIPYKTRKSNYQLIYNYGKRKEIFDL
jgi:hypothetical protein